MLTVRRLSFDILDCGVDVQHGKPVYQRLMEPKPADTWRDSFSAPFAEIFVSGLRVVAMAFPAIVIAGAGSLLPRIRGNPGFWLLRIREGPGFWLLCGLVFFSDTFLWRAEGLFL